MNGKYRTAYGTLLAVMAAICTQPTHAQPVLPTLFVGNNVSDTISVYTVNADGTLDQIPGSPFAAGADVQALALSADGSKLAATNAGKSVNFEELWLFDVADSGALTPVPNAPFLTGDAPLSLAFSATGFVYAPSAFRDEVWAFENVGETLVLVPGAPFPTGPVFPNEIAVAPDGAFVYTSHLFGGISGWRVEANGALTLLPGSPFSNPGDGFELLISPDGKNLYLGQGLSHDIAGYTINANGTLTPLPGSPFSSGGSSAVNLGMTPSGEFLFVVHVVSETVTTMARAADGTLSFVPGSSQFIGSDARKAVASDEYLFVTDDSSIDPGVGVMAYRIEDGGLLTLISGSPFSAGSRPQDMVLFLPNSGDGDGDGDGDVDLFDYESYLNCTTAPNAGVVADECRSFDTEPDNDVDFHDLGALQRFFTGGN